MRNKLLAAKTALPDYDRIKLVPRIVHLGFGALHRAHQGVYTDILAADHGSDWGYCEVNLIGGKQQIFDLKQRDNLYTVAEISADAWTAGVMGAVKNALHAQVGGPESVLAAMYGPQVTIVSLTITEEGYCHSPATGRLILDNPMIAADLQNPRQPKTTPGVVVEALAHRRAAGSVVFTVMPCDNMSENGHVTRNVITAYVRAMDMELAAWIEQHVIFPSAMVDHIVPTVMQKTLDKIEHIIGVRDPTGVAYEPFRQWTIEDYFIIGRLEWGKAGVKLMADVILFGEMKLRMLNGSHSFLVYLGYLAGYQHINDCMGDENYHPVAHALVLQEQAPTLKVKGIGLQCYADLLIERYSNPALCHRTQQIAVDGSQKLPQRILGSIRWRIVHDSDSTLLAPGVAGWVRYVGGADEQGQTIKINDPLLPVIQNAVCNSNGGEGRVQALLAIDAIFGRELPQVELFNRQVTQAYLTLLAEGTKATVAKYTVKLK